MRESLVKLLCCPACKQNLLLRNEQRTAQDIRKGYLSCSNCNNLFEIHNGVPKMITEMGERKIISERYGFTWAMREENKFECESLYGRTEQDELRYFFSSNHVHPSELKGKTILDAGCGCGRLTMMLGAYSREVVGMDLASSINHVYDHCKSLDNVHIVQADLLQLPFRDNSFDYVWSSGAICYTGRSEEAFQRLSSLVKPSGKLFIRVFSMSNTCFVEKMRNVLWFTHKLPVEALFYGSYMLALPWSFVKYLFKRSNHSLRANAFCLFDTLSNPYTRHTQSEVESWFRRERYSIIRSVNHNGVAVSGIKN